MEHFVELIKSLREYFNDFVGAIVPGAVLAAGLTLQWGRLLPTDALARYWGEWSWLPALAILFASGHTLLALHSFAIEIVDSNRALDEAKKGEAFHRYEPFFQQTLPPVGSPQSAGLHALRNYAMTISPTAAEIGRRFMFLALFCYGTATASAVLCISVLAAPFLGQGTCGAMRIAVALALLATVYLLDKRGLTFEVRALRTPFAIACAELSDRNQKPN
jgi:hypothetical protein